MSSEIAVQNIGSQRMVVPHGEMHNVPRVSPILCTPVLEYAAPKIKLSSKSFHPIQKEYGHIVFWTTFKMVGRYMMPMNSWKVYINRENEGEVICPNCGKTKIINVSNHRISQKPIRVKCQCSHSFNIVLEYRRYHRKTVNIPGKLFQRQSTTPVDDVMITSISVVGVGFEIKSAMGVKVDEVYDIVFTLDDDLDSMVREEVMIKRIEGTFVGAEFTDQDKYHHELDFYLTTQIFSP